MKFETHIIDNRGFEHKFVCEVSGVLDETEAHSSFDDNSKETVIENFHMEFLEIGENAEIKIRDYKNWCYEMQFPKSERFRVEEEALDFLCEQLQLGEIYEE